MSAARAGLGDRAALQERHAAAGGSDDPAVDGADARGPAHHPQRADDRTPAFHDGDVRAGAAALDDDGVRKAELVQGGRDSRGGPRADRERGAAAEGLGAHGAAVAAEHEQRHVEPGLLQRVLDHGRRPLDDGEDARVHRSAHRAHLEAVRAGEIVADARGQSACVGAACGQELGVGVVDGEGAADGDGDAAGRDQGVQCGVHLLLVEAAGRVDERVLGLECVARRERDGADLRSLACRAQVGRGTDAEHADAADVALEQGVHRLRRREGHQRDALPRLAELCEERAQRLGDACRDAGFGAVRGRYSCVCEQPKRARLDRHRLGEGPADVDADPDRAAHAPTACAVRRRHGLIAKTQAAPRT